jgi:hypothetical protein
MNPTQTRIQRVAWAMTTLARLARDGKTPRFDPSRPPDLQYYTEQRDGNTRSEMLYRPPTNEAAEILRRGW